VVAADGNPAAPGLKVADVGVATDISKVDDVIQLARAHQVALTLPVPLGRMLTTVGAVNDALGLVGLTEAAAESCTDKILFHERMQAAGLLRPRQQCAHDAQGVHRAIQEIGFPCIVKPRFGSGKKGVVAVMDGSETERAIAEHYHSWTTDAQTLVEELMPGRELGVDGVVLHQRVLVPLVRDKLVTPLPYRQEIQYLAPASIGAELVETVRQTLERAVPALGLDNCLLHADVLIDEHGQCRIIEIAGRPAGLLLTSLLLPAVSGANVLREFIRFQLGEPHDFSPRRLRPACLSFLRLPTGRVSRVPAASAVAEAPGVLAYECRIEPGARLSPITCSRDVLARGYVLTTAETLPEAQARVEAILREFRVASEE